MTGKKITTWKKQYGMKPATNQTHAHYLLVLISGP